MKWITFALPPLEYAEQFDALVEELGGNPEGIEERHVGTAEDGKVCAVTMWETKAHADRFFSSEFFAEKLGPAFAAVLGREPEGRPVVVGMDPARSFFRNSEQ
jgi:hypothetical protein